MTECKWPNCIEDGCTPLARLFKSCYGPMDACTQDDRDKIVAAAQKRVFEIYTLADKLDSYGGAKMPLPNHSGLIAPARMRAAMLDAAAQLRQLIE